MVRLTPQFSGDHGKRDPLPALWPLGADAQPDYRERVLAAAVGTDLLILSTSANGVMPPVIEALVWTFLCLRPRTTILALLGNQADWCIFLQEILADPLHSSPSEESVPSAALRQLRFQVPIRP